jgi:HAD superfamily hydrolase (TIGR01509 family)
MTAAAVLWDMDGVLVDSEPLWTVAETELYASWGRVWTDEVKAACVGKRLDDAVPVMIAMAGVEADEADAAAFLLARMTELLRTAAPWRSGARELVTALAARGVPQALVSSSFRVLVDAVLDQVGRGAFAVTLAGDEVQHPKPHPQPYLDAAAALGVDPTACVVIEDSLTGVAAAEAAGCVCLAVPEVVHVEPGPRRPVVEDLATVDVDWLLALPLTLPVVAEA